MPRVPQTHCRAGHELSWDNVYLTALSDGRVQRKCRACALAAGQERHQRKMRTDPAYRAKQRAGRQRFTRRKREWFQQQEDAKLSAPASTYGFTDG